jgi:hypothetical protein
LKTNANCVLNVYIYLSLLFTLYRKKEKALIERFLTLIKDYFGKEISQSDRNNLKERFAKYK